MMMHRRLHGLIDFFTTGDIDRFETFAAADRELCEAAAIPFVSSDWSWLGWCRFLRGDWYEAIGLFAEAVRREPPGSAMTGWNAAMLFECLAYRGDKTKALAVLDGRRFPQVGEPKPFGAVALLMAAAEGLTVLGEREQAAQLYPLIVDCYERTRVPCPSYDDLRLIQRAAGIAALAAGDFEAAEAHFRIALEQATTIPHRIEEAHTRRWYGQMLLERRGPGDQKQAEALLRAAIDDYERMGMPKHRDLTASLES